MDGGCEQFFRIEKGMTPFIEPDIGHHQQRTHGQQRRRDGNPFPESRQPGVNPDEGHQQGGPKSRDGKVLQADVGGGEIRIADGDLMPGRIRFGKHPQGQQNHEAAHGQDAHDQIIAPQLVLGR